MLHNINMCLLSNFQNILERKTNVLGKWQNLNRETVWLTFWFRGFQLKMRLREVGKGGKDI